MKETDLDNVKAMAKIFLEIEIGETEMSPAIVQHPFTNSGFYPCRSDDGNLRVIDITSERPQGKMVCGCGVERFRSIYGKRYVDGIVAS